MFENLTKREKILAGVVGSLLPIAAIFMAFIWFIDSYNTNEQRLIQTQVEIDKELDKRDARDRAVQRKKYYQSISFPSDEDDADNEYQYWLRNIDPKMPIQLRTVRGGITKFGKQVVFEQRGYKIDTRGTLSQITQFLYKFHSLPLLHRINKVSITPRNSGSTGKASTIRTGEHKLSIGVDVISVRGAEEKRDFLEGESIELAKSLEEYNQKIIYRNIFGPANNSPTVKASPNSKYYPDGDIAFRVSGDDADEADQLTFELVDCKIEGAQLVGESGERTAQFKAPPQAIGDYKFQVKVTDNGNPPKSFVKDVSVAVVKRPNAKPGISLSSSALKIEEGQPVEIEFKGTDADKDDALNFELVSSEVKGLKIEDLGDRKWKLMGPELDEGSYDFKLKVVDNADEPKDYSKSYTLKIVPPKFLNASKTQITGILGSPARPMCWIYVRPTDEFHKLRIGDTFKVDRKEWKVEKIDLENLSVWLLHENQLKLYEPDDFLVSPRRVEKVVESASATVSEVKEDALTQSKN